MDRSRDTTLLTSCNTHQTTSELGPHPEKHDYSHAAAYIKPEVRMDHTYRDAEPLTP